MKKSAQIIICTLLPFAGIAQEVNNKLKFQQGQEISIKVTAESKVSQEAMGQAIDFNTTMTLDHGYVVTNSTADNTTLHHDIRRIVFSLEGMGQNKNFDSQNPDDLNSEIGVTVKEVLSKSYDVIIDPTGKVLMSKPETITLTKADAAAIIMSLQSDQMSVVFPPKKNEPGFFKILPAKKVDINGGWVETKESGDEKSSTSYTLKEITDSTMVIDFKGTSNTSVKSQMMGMETLTKMNHHFTGTIILDKETLIMREKTTETESNGSTEMMGGTLPVTTKSKVHMVVK